MPNQPDSPNRLAHAKLPALSMVQLLKLMSTSLVLAVILSEAYEVAARWLTPLWLAAATLHLLLAVLCCAYWLRHRTSLFRLGPWQSYAPGLIIFIGSVMIALISHQLGASHPAHLITPSPTHLAWIFGIPVVEEMVFRAGIGQCLQRLGPPLWAAWFSSAVFAMVHAHATWNNLLAGRIGLALGPFILGLACEYLLATSGRILPCITLHAACNATPLIFGMLDERWLEWLGPLYL